MTKILITGANGTIGSDLVNFFSKKNKIIALYRTPNFVSKNLKNKNIRWVRQDLKKKALGKINPKVIIHCAVSHEFSKKRKCSDLIESNITSLKNLIDFAKEKKVKFFFNFSSVKMYGDIREPVLKDSNDFINPDFYGLTKIIGEKMLQSQKINYLNIRLPGVLCYSINYSTRPWLNTIINKLEKNEIVKIFN